MSIIAKLKSDELLRHAGVLFSGMMVVHVCNMLYQMVVSRALPKDEYALLAAFLGVLAIIARPLGTMTSGMSHYSGLLLKENRAGDVKRLLCKWILLAGVPALFLALSGFFAGRMIADFFHLERVEPVLVASLSLPALFLFPVLAGCANGLQLFGMGSAAAIAGALARVGIGAAMVFLLYPACGWALVGHGAGMYLSVLGLLGGLFFCLRDSVTSGLRLPSMRLYLLQSFFIQISYAVLMTADVVLVKHYLPAETDFAYAATLGRLVAFLPAAVAGAMFPKVVSGGEMTAEHRSIFMRSFFYTFLCVLAAVAGCWILPKLALRILFRIQDASTHLIWLTRWMAVVMGISALLNIIVQFLLAQRRFKCGLAVVAGAGLYLGAVALFHESAGQILVLAGVANLVVLSALLFWSGVTGNE